LVIVSHLETIVEDLKSLPPGKLEVAAEFIQRLKRTAQEDREALLATTFGRLSSKEADELERVIDEGCEKVDEHGW